MSGARIILADPDWDYNNRMEFRRDNPAKATKSGTGAAGKYKRRTGNAGLVAMGHEVGAVCMHDAYLFMWVTLPLLLQRPSVPSDVIHAWGFRYVGAAFIWIKTTKYGECWQGPGSYVPANIEICTLSVRGRPWHTSKGSKPRQEILEYATRGDEIFDYMDPVAIRRPHDRHCGKIIHSRKPFDVHQRIEEWLFPQIGEGYALELFATKHRPRWICLGDGVTGNDQIQDLRDLALS